MNEKATDLQEGKSELRPECISQLSPCNKQPRREGLTTTYLLRIMWVGSLG